MYTLCVCHPPSPYIPNFFRHQCLLFFFLLRQDRVGKLASVICILQVELGSIFAHWFWSLGRRGGASSIINRVLLLMVLSLGSARTRRFVTHVHDIIIVIIIVIFVITAISLWFGSRWQVNILEEWEHETRRTWQWNPQQLLTLKGSIILPFSM